MSAWIWASVPAAPLLAALLLFACRARTRALAPWLSLSLLPALLACVIGDAAFTPAALWEGARWAADSPVTRPWLAFTATLWGIAGYYAGYSQRDDAGLLRFWLFWLTALSGNLLLIIAQDALSFYVGFSMMSLSAYGLVIHSGKPQARRAGRLYLQLAVLGEVLLLLGLAMRVHAADGALLFADWSATPVTPVSAALLLTGLGLKAGFWPLHVWLPQAHPVAPAPASAVLSGAMLKAGILGLWQFLPGALPEADNGVLSAWATPVMAIAVISIVLAAVFGLTRNDAKQALAYSSVSQMGFLLFLIALGWLLPGQRATIGVALTLYAVHHAFAKGALFMAANVVKAGGAPLRLHQGWLVVAIGLPALALAGLPLSSGAAAKTALKAMLEDPALSHWLVWLQIGALGTTLVVARACYLLWQLWQKAGEKPAGPDMPLAAVLAWLILCAASVSLPWLWPLMQPAAVDSLPLYKWQELGWPIGVGVLLAVLAWRYHWQAPSALQRQHTPLLHLSLGLKRRLNQALLPSFTLTWLDRDWRRHERRWSRFWQGHTVNRSATLLLIFMIVAGLTIFRPSDLQELLSWLQ
ncbi:MAG: sodium:proton antiporter [Gammaproteobacteria bacterium]|nr:sodium:proton antiporter [Gammaproteobacteria bacterium]